MSPLFTPFQILPLFPLRYLCICHFRSKCLDKEEHECTFIENFRKLARGERRGGAWWEMGRAKKLKGAIVLSPKDCVGWKLGTDTLIGNTTRETLRCTVVNLSNILPPAYFLG